MPIRQNLTHEILETGTAPHRQFTVVFYNEDKSVDTFDGREWKHYPAKQEKNIFLDAEIASL